MADTQHGYSEPATPNAFLDAETTGRLSAGVPVRRQRVADPVVQDSLEEILALLAIAGITISNPTADPETGLAKELTLESLRADIANGIGVVVGNPTTNPETGLAKDLTLESLRADVANGVGVTVANPTADPETGLAKTVDVEAVRDRLPQDAVSGGVEVRDTFSELKVLPDQSGNGSVRTFTFTSPCDLIWVRVDDADGRAHVDEDPSASLGIICEDGIPQPLTVRADEVRVFAAAGSIAVWGYGA